jgi:PTH1 family peptidyl-tRNA hydrolase
MGFIWDAFRGRRKEIPGHASFLVLGLGNPGPRYEATRHNFGFFVVDALARTQGETLRDGPGPCRICPFTEGPLSGILAKPTTYVNRSGAAARALLERFEGLSTSRLLVIADDLDLPLGRMRFRRDGGDGGHNGLRSLIEELKARDFPRLRLGIGRPLGNERGEIIDHVLDRFHPEELKTVNEVVERAVEGVREFVSSGIDVAMNRYNAG